MGRLRYAEFCGLTLLVALSVPRVSVVLAAVVVAVIASTLRLMLAWERTREPLIPYSRGLWELAGLAQVMAVGLASGRPVLFAAVLVVLAALARFSLTARTRVLLEGRSVEERRALSERPLFFPGPVASGAADEGLILNESAPESIPRALLWDVAALGSFFSALLVRAGGYASPLFVPLIIAGAAVFLAFDWALLYWGPRLGTRT